MLDPQERVGGLRQRQPLLRGLATEQLQVHGFAGANQLAVQHRMRDDTGRLRVGVGQAEVPRRDAIIPATAHERDVTTQTRKDEQPPQAVALGLGLGQPVGDSGKAAGIGLALPQHSPQTIADGHLGTGHRHTAIQCRHPDHRGVGTVLEMHRQVGDQRRGADMPDTPATVVQLLAETRAGDLDDVQAGMRQWHTDHLGEARIPARNAQRHTRITGREQRHAGVVRLLVASQPRHDADLVRGGHPPRRQGRSRRRGLRRRGASRRLHQAAQRQWQRWRRLQLQYAEASTELRQRGQLVERHHQWKFRGVHERAPGIVHQARRQLHAQPSLGRERPREHERLSRSVCGRTLELGWVDTTRSGIHEPHLGEAALRHRRTEA